MEQLYAQIQARLGQGEARVLDRWWFSSHLERVALLPSFSSVWQPLLASYQHSWQRPLFFCHDIPQLERLAALFPEMYFDLRLHHKDDYYRLFEHPALAQVSHLKFFRCGFGGDDVDALLQSPYLGPLCGLSIEHEDLWEDDLALLVQHKKLGGLRSLSLLFNALGSEALSMVAQALPELIDLDFEDNYINDQSVSVFVQSPVYQQLQALSLIKTQITNTSAHLLATTPKTTLLTLHVEYNDIDEDGWRAMASSAWLCPDTQKRCKSILAELALDE